MAMGALLIGALYAAWQLQRGAEKVKPEAQVTLHASALAALFVGLAAMGDLLLDPADADLGTLQRMLGSLGYFVALPFLASALVVAVRDDHWSRPAWGRWLIGLFAFFELFRRMEQGELYTQIIAVLVPAVMLIAALMQSQKLLRGMSLFATVNMALALVIVGPGTLLSEYNSDFVYSLLLAAALPLTATAILQTVRYKADNAS